MVSMKDLWTTRCTRCPAALDTLNLFAARATERDSGDVDSEVATSVQCISICCGDTLDGAREIIEATKFPRWGAIRHFFMAYHDKELCKQMLKFRQVPFYIVFDSSGALLYSGSQKLDWQTMFLENFKSKKISGEVPSFNIANIMESSAPSPTSAITIPRIQLQQQQEENSAFVIDDMDF